MNAEESASEAWAKIVQHYWASGLKEHRSLTIDLYMLKDGAGRTPTEITALCGSNGGGTNIEQVDRPVDPKGIDIVILSGLTPPQYDAEARMLESSSDWPTREWIKRAVINQQLECEKFAAGSRTVLYARGHRRNDKPPSDAPFPPAQDTLFQVTRRETKPNGYQRDGEHGGKGGGGRNGKGDGNGGGGDGNGGGGDS